MVSFLILLYYYLFTAFLQLFYLSYLLYQFLFLLLVLSDQKNPSLQEICPAMNYPYLLQ